MNSPLYQYFATLATGNAGPCCGISLVNDNARVAHSLHDSGSSLLAPPSPENPKKLCRWDSSGSLARRNTNFSSELKNLDATPRVALIRRAATLGGNSRGWAGSRCADTPLKCPSRDQAGFSGLNGPINFPSIILGNFR